MTLDPTSLALTGLGLTLVVLAGGLLRLHLKNRVVGLGPRDNLRAVLYLTRYEAALEYHGLRRREIRAQVDELRADLAESATDGGAAAALDRLGPPRVLATEVVGVRMVPSWSRGALWAAAAAAFGVLALVMSADAFHSAVETAAAPGTTATWSTFP